MNGPKSLLGLIALAAGIAAATDGLCAQEVRVLSAGGDTVVVSETAAPAGVSAKAEGSEAASKSEKPEGEKKSPDEEKGKSDKEKEKPDEKEKEEPDKGPEPIQRPATPSEPPDPDELKIRPDEQGKIRFNFVGQPWPEVLDWLADVSGMSLDWQELPGDYLNLKTQRGYTLDEARDLINRHLLARGYTLLRHGELLSVVNLEKLNPGMVPRVDPEGLDERDPHEFVKVSFPLDWLLAPDAVEELKPMLSPHGKLTALKTTNRLEAVDAVVNLLGIRRLLAEEQSSEGEERLVREFVLEYARAEDVHQQLETLLGVEPKPKTPQAMTSDQIRRMQEAARKAAQEAQKGGKPAAPAKAEPKVTLVVNQRRNSILAHAPPDKMAIIEQAVEALDVPPDPSDSLLATINRMQIYRLAAIDPEPLVKTLMELGDLDPRTRLDVDEKNRAIIAYAPLADHMTIRSLIDKLDGSNRKFDVIPLRRLPADYVAGTIEFMMSGGQEETPRYSRYYYNYGSRSRGSEEEQDRFRVDADVENNRLLLWANEVEKAEVMNLLVKLGEIPPEGGNTSRIRVLEGTWGPETDAWLERVRQAWPSVAPNPLVLPPKSSDESPDDESGETEAADPASPKEGVQTRTSPGARGVQNAREFGFEAGARGGPLIRLAQLRHPQSDDAVPAARQTDEQPPHGEAAEKQAPPIQISRGPDGRVVITSEDTRALDLLEDMMNQMAPPRIDYKIFRLRYAWAYGLALTLEDIFQEEEEESRPRYPYFYYRDYDDRGDSDDSRVRLSKRRPLKFIADPDTNSILVEGADPTQMAKIEELIEFYDQPEPVESESIRKTQIFQLRYAKATTVAEAVKDVYRDLLSANDKALLAGQRERQSPRESYTFIYDSGDGQRLEEKAPRFQGALSIGINELSNTLIVSAKAYLLDDILQIIEALDEAARPTAETVQLLRVGQGVDISQVQEKLSSLLGGGAAGRRASERPTPSEQRSPERDRSQRPDVNSRR